MTAATQWTLLRTQIVAEAATGKSALVEILDGRESRRDEVLSSLEDGRQQSLKSSHRRRR